MGAAKILDAMGFDGAAVTSADAGFFFMGLIVFSALLLTVWIELWNGNDGLGGRMNRYRLDPNSKLTGPYWKGIGWFIGFIAFLLMMLAGSMWLVFSN